MKKVCLIAEIAQAHDGSLGILHSYIDAVAKTGVDIIKFQTHIASAESSSAEPFRKKFSYVDKTRYDYWKRMEFTKEQWVEIKKHCEDVGLEFLSSPFSLEAVELLEEIGVKRYKIGSGEVSNLLMLERIAKTKKPIILSSGMSSYSELDKAIETISKYHKHIEILHCTTAYPTSATEIGLNVITEMLARYDYPVGLSDHSGEVFTSIAATALGAKLLEFHVVFDKKMFGPDATSSIEIKDLAEMVRGIRFVETILANPINKNDTQKFSALKEMFGKSIAIRNSMRAGQQITEADLESKKPGGMGISADLYQTVIGKKINKNIEANSFLQLEDLD